MKPPANHRAVMQSLIANQNADLRTLASIAGLNPATDLIGADFRGADFGEDDLAGFNFSRADLRGADLSRARGVDRAMFADRIEDASTRWPDRRTPVPGTMLRDAAIAPELVLLPPGRFVMGTPDAEDAREHMPEQFVKQSKPQREVLIRTGFWLARYPVTRGEFAAFVADRGRDMSGGAFGWSEAKKEWERSDEFGWNNPGFEQTDRHPVVCVSHVDAEAYAEWLSERTRKQYRLPTEAEWEYAARAGTTTARFWGDDRDGARRHANVPDRSLAKRMKRKMDREQFFPWDDGYPFTSPVGSFQPNQFGLYDMLGNVWEWVADPWHDSYDGAPSNEVAWVTDRNESRRVLRGGSWHDGPRLLRAGVRSWDDAGYRGNVVGFRLARTL